MKIMYALVFVLALLVLAIGQYAPKDTAQTLPSLPTFALDDVASFGIYSGEKTSVQGRHEEGKWLYPNGDKSVYLQAIAVEQLLHDLQTMQVKRVASTKKEHHIRFSVDDSEVVLKDAQNQVLLDIFIGKPATDLRRTYIRLANQDTVLTVDKVLTWQVKRTTGAWLEKTKFAEEKDPESSRPHQ